MPVHLLVFGVQTAITTLTCLVDMLSWPGYTIAEQTSLSSLYVPYLLLAIVMATDAYLRLQTQAYAKEKST